MPRLQAADMGSPGRTRSHPHYCVSSSSYPIRTPSHLYPIPRHQVTRDHTLAAAVDAFRQMRGHSQPEDLCGDQLLCRDQLSAQPSSKLSAQPSARAYVEVDGEANEAAVQAVVEASSAAEDDEGRQALEETILTT